MKRVHGRAIYLATIVAIFGMVGGFALASIALSTTNQNAEGNFVSSAGAVTGLTYTSTVLGATASPAPSASTGSAATPQALVAGANAFCANTCTASNYAEIVTYTFTTSLTGSVQITIQVSTSAGTGTATLFLAQANTPTSGTISMTWDLGSASVTLNSVTLTAQQCTGAAGACP